MNEKEHRPQIVVAAEFGELQAVESCISQGENVNARDTAQEFFCQTPLMRACAGGHVEVADALISAGAVLDAISRVNESFNYGERVMLFHTSWEDCEQSGTPMGWTALHLAARYGHEACLSLLIERGADVDQLTAFGSPPLHIAIEAKQVEVVRRLVESGANVNARDHGKATPLHIAAFWNQVDAASSLCDAQKTKIDLKDKEGFTPLHVAINEASRDVIPVLLKANADLNKKSRDGRNAADLAQDIGGATKRCFFSLTNIEKPHLTSEQIHDAISNNDIETLRQAPETGWNALSGSPGFDGWTPLGIAVLHARPSMVDFLIEAGCDVNQRNADSCGGSDMYRGASPLHVVFGSQVFGDRKFNRRAKPLLEAGADVNLPNAIGRTPLLQLAQTLNVDWLKEVISWGGDPTYRSEFGESALTVAKLEWMGVQRYPEFALDQEPAYLQCVEVLQQAESPDQPEAWYQIQQHLQKREWNSILSLLKESADPNLTQVRPGGDGPESTLLQCVCASCDDGDPAIINIVQNLLRLGADPNRTTVYDQTPPLFEAVQHANVEIARLLLESGADTSLCVEDSTVSDYFPSRKADRTQMRDLLSEHDSNLSAPKPTLGLMSSDGNYISILVEAGAKRVATFLASYFKDAKSWQPREGVPDIDGLVVLAWTDGDSPLPWVSIHPTGKQASISDERFSTAISEQLKTRSLLVQCSDTAGYTGYDVFHKGECVEKYQSFPADSPSFDGPPVFETSMRKRTLLKEDRIDDLLRELNVLVPYGETVDDLDPFGSWAGYIRQVFVVKIPCK